MDKLEQYTPGTKCWFKDTTLGYVPAQMVNKDLANGKVTMTFNEERYLIFDKVAGKRLSSKRT
jgi:hypothetical protein